MEAFEESVIRWFVSIGKNPSQIPFFSTSSAMRALSRDGSDPESPIVSRNSRSFGASPATVNDNGYFAVVRTEKPQSASALTRERAY